MSEEDKEGDGNLASGDETVSRLQTELADFQEENEQLKRAIKSGREDHEFLLKKLEAADRPADLLMDTQVVAVPICITRDRKIDTSDCKAGEQVALICFGEGQLIPLSLLADGIRNGLFREADPAQESDEEQGTEQGE